MREIEKRIQEKRTIEATRKKLIGFNGKLGCIARNLGQPLIAQVEGGMCHDIYGMDDPYALPDDSDPFELKDGYAKQIMDQITVMEVRDAAGNPLQRPDSPEWGDEKERVEYSIYETGWYFDGLSRGMHLEIKYDDSKKILLARYQGYEVYKEVAGEIYAYAPSPEWEDKVDQLYKVAKELDKGRKQMEREEEMETAKKEKNSWWTAVRQRWGM